MTQTRDTPSTAPATRVPPHRIHPAWGVAAVAFLVIVAAAAFGSAPGLLVEPLHHELGWSRGTIGLGVSVQLALYGLTAPFAAALMDRFGIRPVLLVALALITGGALATIWMTAPWQFVLGWGALVGLGTGSMALAFSSTITQRWFVRRRGLVSGVLTAGSASGQLVFLPLLSWLIGQHGWRSASVTVGIVAALAVPLVLLAMRDHPADAGVPPYGSDVVEPRPAPRTGAGRRTVAALTGASRTSTFWLLAGAFAICGASTNGLVKTHFVPAAHDHGMSMTAGATLLAVVGVFDIAGTIFSGWLTDRVSPRLLLGVYYTLRGVALMTLPSLLGPQVEPPMVFFIVFYGLDWVATVPPTMALCREHYGQDASIVFGWVLAAHQVGAGLVAWLGGVVRDATGTYDGVWYGAGLLCAGAALMSLLVRRLAPPGTPRP
ncbi:major facilitator superfamily MFS_1 [Xylanimonas cellulosilytica DSM 15894]|uniref:Major facilitator superfamily MFS_1 n=1 Tax=Xylanimonas cellulosilytica (strain DSM 15894 / JCM 12276 / CECT 5975 / KCTC 9989 / LMG 20990 / NBRC 107835 / XIL07) TaxID=446471 RepID=D1BV67_XYLCX|nr:MFS transporter [Xylanimonas cellulosilytica]ACZ31306.1 major facilitator superfamily MFS_1 [Xylanimonas cellulosilytica DSM 15894]